MTKHDWTNPPPIHASEPCLPELVPSTLISKGKEREYLITMRVTTTSDQLLTALPFWEEQPFSLDTLLVTSIQNSDLPDALRAHSATLLTTAHQSIYPNPKGEYL